MRGEGRDPAAAEAVSARSSWALSWVAVSAVALLEAAGLAADFPAAVARREAAGRQGAGDAIEQGTARSGFGCHSCGGATHQRANRLRLSAGVGRLCPHPNSVGERARADRAVADDCFHSVERPADFFDPDRDLCCCRAGVLLDAGAARARSTLSAACTRAPRRARAEI